MKSRKKKKEFYTEYTARNALKNGSFIVRLSAIVFGLGCLVHKQIAKGILYLTSEILLIVYMVQTGFYNLSKFRTLGDVEQQKVWNEAKSLYEYVDGDRSLIILLYGIVTLSLILAKNSRHKSLSNFRISQKFFKTGISSGMSVEKGRTDPDVKAGVKRIIKW